VRVTGVGDGESNPHYQLGNPAADALEALANPATRSTSTRRWTGEEFNPEALDLALMPRSSASADQFTISGVELSISSLAVRLTATNLVVTRR
jgi:hypothetical protein